LVRHCRALALPAAAVQIVRGQRGTPPADAPVEPPEPIARVLNARTARAAEIGLPSSVPRIADEAIE